MAIFSSMFFVISSATRGEMAASAFSLLSIIIVYYHKFLRSALILSLALIIAYILLPQRVVINMNLAFQRFMTIESIAQGDLTANNTAIRFTERGPRVLAQYYNSPIFGFGYSKITDRYYDEHVGNHSMLLIGGIIGLYILTLTLYLLINWIYRIQNSFNYLEEAKGFIVLIFGIIAIFIIHSTSRDMMSYYIPFNSAFLITIYLSIPNAFLNQEIKKRYLNQSNYH